MQQPREGDQVGRYRLGPVLGHGGMGVVHTATDTALDRAVAVKMMLGAYSASAEHRARFNRETATLARLDAPHVIGILDHGEHPGPGGTPFLVTRLVRGGDLGALIRSRGPLPPHLAVTVCAQVAEALRDAHAAGVVHRDVKPANVLLRDAAEPTPYVFLCDFGIATLDGDSLTRTGGVSGTWSYLSPERIDGGPGTPASDLYALGCLLWTCLTGGPPWTGPEYAVATAHRQAPVPQLPGTDPVTTGLNRFLAGALAKQPGDRPADAEQARRALAALAAVADTGSTRVAAAPSPAAPAPPAPPGHTVTRSAAAPGRRRGRAALVGIAALVLVGAAVAAGVVVADRVGGPDEPAAGPDSPGEVDPSEGTGPSGEPGVTGDLDGDGLGDVLVQVGRNRDTRLLAFGSDGTSLSAPTERDGWPGTSLIGDVDGDGRSDVVTPGAGPDDDLLVRVDLANGEQSRVSVPNPSAGTGTTSAPFLVDLTGDGTLTLALAGETDGALRLRTVDLDGGSGLVTRDLHDAAATGLLQPADVDGDGADELVVVAEDRAVADTYAGQVLRLDGDALVQDGSAFSVGPVGLGLIFTADTDADGADELVRLDLEPDGGFQGLQTFDSTTDDSGQRSWEALEPTAVEGVDGDLAIYPAIADLDGDGAEDVVLLRQVGGEVVLDAFLADEGALVPNGPWGAWSCGGSCGLTIDGVGSSG